MHSNPKNILCTALLITASVALFPTSAAAGPLTYATGDLLAGFRAGNGTDTKDFMIDLGSYTLFTTGASPATPLAIGAIGADLVAVFGANWKTRPDLFWSVVGTESVTKSNTLYITAPELTLHVAPGSPAPINSNSTQSPVAGKFDAAGAAYALNGDSATGSGGAATNSKGLRQLTTDNNSWSSFNGGSQAFSGNAWSYFSPATEANFGSGTATSALDLYQIIRSGAPFAAPTAGAITNIGYFTINDSGVISFGSPGPSPVPEPTSVFLLASSLGVFGLKRRRGAR